MSQGLCLEKKNYNLENVNLTSLLLFLLSSHATIIVVVGII